MIKLIVLVLNCCLGSLCLGFFIGQMNVIADDVYKAYGITETYTKGLISSMMTLGGAIGSFFCSIILRYLSRKHSLQLVDCLVFLSVSICFLDTHIRTLLISRFLIGLSLGVNGVVIPLYIKEMSPPSKSGLLGTFNQLLITLGILLAFGMGYLSTFDLSIEFYKLMLFCPIIPCAIRAVCLETIFNYETPLYCSKHQLNDKLEVVLKAIYKDDHREWYHQNRENPPMIQKGGNRAGFLSLIGGKYKKRFLLGCSLSVLQQLGGINGIMFYSSQIFDQITNHDSAMVYRLNLIVGFIGILTAVLSSAIIEKFGRKTIMKWGSLICFISLQSLTILLTQDFSSTPLGKILIVFLIFSFLFGFGFSIGAILFIYLTETLPEQGVSFAAFLNWCSGGLVAQLFPIIAAYNINYCFAIFSLFNLLGFCIIHGYMIETKGLNELEIDRAFQSYQETPQEDIM